MRGDAARPDTPGNASIRLKHPRLRWLFSGRTRKVVVASSANEYPHAGK